MHIWKFSVITHIIAFRSLVCFWVDNFQWKIPFIVYVGSTHIKFAIKFLHILIAVIIIIVVEIFEIIYQN